jgi:hypothetical protein
MGGTVAMKARLMIIVRKSLCEENLNLMRWRNPPPCPPNCLCRNRSPRCLLPGLIGIAIFALPLSPSLPPPSLSYIHTFHFFFFSGIHKIRYYTNYYQGKKIQNRLFLVRVSNLGWWFRFGSIRLSLLTC